MKIDRNIPIPAKTPGRPFKHPWLDLQVGDSFEYPGTIHTGYTLIQRIQNRYDRRFTARTMPSGKLRIWRVL